MDKFSFLQQANLPYIEEQYQLFLRNPESVEEKWRLFFEGVEFAQRFGGSGGAGASGAAA